MSRAFRFALRGEEKGVRVFLVLTLRLTFPLANALASAVGVAGETSLSPSSKPSSSWLYFKHAWFLAIKIYLRTCAFLLQEQNKTCIKQKKENSTRALLKKRCATREGKMVFWLNCQWNQAKSWKLYRMPNTSGDRDTLLHVFVCVCTIGDTNMYGLVQIKKCFYLLFWSMVLFFYIFNTYCTDTHKTNIFYSSCLKISCVMAFASILKLISGLHKKSKLYSSVKHQQ